MSYTLAQYAEVETDVLKKGIIQNIIRESPVMGMLPFQETSSFQSSALRWKSLPSVAFRDLNETYTEGTNGHVEEVWEGVYIFGGEIRFDRMYDKVKNYVQDPKVTQMEMKVTSMAYTWNNYFINGDQAVDPKGFEGLRKRVDGMPARQSVYFAGAAGDATAALDPTASAANARTFMTALETMWKRCNNGDVGMIVCNEGLVLGLGRVLRYANTAAGVGLLDATQDTFGRTFYTYRGKPLIDIGTLKDMSTEIITETETGNDGTGNATSIYMVSTGTGPQQLSGLQLSPLETVDLAIEQGGVTTGKLIEWAVGLYQIGSYGVVRGRNLEGAANWTA
jgi:hypothetical protein